MTTSELLLLLVKRYHMEREDYGRNEEIDRKVRTTAIKTLDVFMSNVESDLQTVGLTLEGLEDPNAV